MRGYDIQYRYTTTWNSNSHTQIHYEPSFTWVTKKSGLGPRPTNLLLLLLPFHTDYSDPEGILHYGHSPFQYLGLGRNDPLQVDERFEILRDIANIVKHCETLLISPSLSLHRRSHPSVSTHRCQRHAGHDRLTDGRGPLPIQLASSQSKRIGRQIPI